MSFVRRLAALPVLVLVLALLASRASAGDQSAHLKSGVRVRTWSPWPASVHSGWAPIFVELENASQRERTIELEAIGNDWNAERSVRAVLTLGPGASAALELLVPLGAAYSNEYRVEVDCGDEQEFLSGVVGANGSSSGMRQVLFVSESTPGAGMLERWSAELSTVVTHGPFAGIGASSSRSAASTPNDIEVAHTGFGGLARHQGAYSSLDLVVLDPARGLPGEAELAGLAAWVRTGGSLLVLGAGGLDAAATSATLAAWMEPRFEAWQDAGAEYRMGLGRLCVGAVPGDLESAPYVEWVRALLAANFGPTPRAMGWRGGALTPAIPGLVQLPFRAFAGLLMLFAIVIGPVNFVFVKKKKRPALLLLTIPVIAGVTTLALLAYGILFQGLDVKTASYTVAVLDQREHRSACVESRQLFAGMAPAAGLALGAGTIVHDLPASMSFSGNRASYEVEFAGGLMLSGEYLPSRKAKAQVLVSERSERARLDVHADGNGLRVDNNLGTSLRELVLRDPEGELHRLADALAPGESAALVRVEPDSEAFARLHAEVDALLDSSLSPLAPKNTSPLQVVAPGTYLARLEHAPFRDDCGIETRELFGRHVLFGVLALAPEDWK